MATKWIETTHEAYDAIYAAHHEDLRVFASYTHCIEPEELLTEWGFNGADYPIIKSEFKGGVRKFFIARITNDEA